LATVKGSDVPALAPTGMVMVAPLLRVMSRSLPVTGTPTLALRLAMPPSLAVTLPSVRKVVSIVSLTCAVALTPW